MLSCRIFLINSRRLWATFFADKVPKTFSLRFFLLKQWKCYFLKSSTSKEYLKHLVWNRHGRGPMSPKYYPNLRKFFRQPKIWLKRMFSCRKTDFFDKICHRGAHKSTDRTTCPMIINRISFQHWLFISVEFLESWKFLIDVHFCLKLSKVEHSLKIQMFLLPTTSR